MVDWRRSKRDDKKVREAILSEIKANVEYGMRTDPFWMDNIYKNHLDKIYGFKIERFQKINRFYALIDKYREREAQYSADLQRGEETELSRIHQQVLGDMERKIRALGNEILSK